MFRSFARAALALAAAATAAAAAADATAAAVQPLWIDGFVAATFSPFAADGSVALDVVPAQARWLQDTGVTSVFVCGTTGESYTMTVEERKAQAEAWVQAAKPLGISVIVHVGAESLGDAAALAAHASAIGADAIGAMASVFFKPATPAALARFCHAIASAAADLPFYYYHIPSMTGVTFAMTDLVAEVAALPEFSNFAGIKYTGLYNTPGFMDVVTLLEDSPEVEVLGGRDEMIVQMIAAGLKGFVGSQYNIICDLYADIRAKAVVGKLREARKIQKLAIDFIRICIGVGPGVNGFKAALNLVLPVGGARLPAVAASAAALSKLSTDLTVWCAQVAAVKGPQTLFCKFLTSGGEDPSEL